MSGRCRPSDIEADSPQGPRSETLRRRCLTIATIVWNSMANRASLVVRLPKNRDLSGILHLLDKRGKQIGKFEVLGRGSRGPGETSLLNKGNTPTGTYDASEIVDTGGWSESSYGRYGAIRLKPLSGNAVVAEAHGRSGLLIHGGDTGAADYWRGADALRATHGCLRLRNSDIKALIKLIQDLRMDEYDRVCWTHVNVNLEVLETS